MGKPSHTSRDMEGSMNSSEMLPSNRVEMAAAPATAPEARKAKSSPKDWLKRVSTVQEKNATPEIIERLKRQSEASARRERMSKKGKKLQMSNALCQASFNTRMKSMASPMVEQQYEERALSARMESIRAVVQRSAVASAEQDSEDEAELETLGAEMGLALGAAPEQVEEEGQAEFATLLDQLRCEPVEELEVEAKFNLYSTYLETVEKTRNALLQFWAEAEEDFHADGRREVAHLLKKIDSADNMGVEFVEGRWFVYDMTRKAGSNCKLMGQTLATIKSRLELLGREDDCPICMEKIDACGEAPHVFGCCHKVCGECWEHWSEMNRGRTFCPLCRHEEFVGDLLRRASQLE